MCAQPLPEPGADGLTVTVYEICEEGAGSGDRILAGSTRGTSGRSRRHTLIDALEALLAGPTREEADAWFGSWFSSATTEALLEASVGTNGVAAIDLDRDSTTASTT